MDRSLRPTCFVCLEVPLTVTFTVINDTDSLHWTSRYSESEHSEEEKSSATSLVREQSPECIVYESTPVSTFEATVQAVEATNHCGPFEISNCNIASESENEHNKGLDLSEIQNCTFNNGTTDHANTSSVVGLRHHSDVDGHTLVNDEHPRDIFVFGLPCGRQNLYLDNLTLLSDNIIFPVSSQSLLKLGLSRSQDKVTTMHSRERLGETNSTDLFPFQRGIPGIAESSAVQKELKISQNEIELDLSRGIAESSLNEISDVVNEKTRELNGNNLSTSAASNNFKQKDEKSHLDPGYFTEEGNEGSKDDLHANDFGIPDDSVSNTLLDKRVSCDNGFHDEIHEIAARKDGARPKIGILKHSKTSASFDLHTEHLPGSLRENWTDCSHLLSNTMPSKTVAFHEQQLPKQKWDFTADTSEAMDRLRAITSHLCLPIVCGNQTDGLKEHHSHPKASQLWRFKSSTVAQGTSLADDSDVNLTLTFQDINKFVTGIEQELFQIQKADEMIASQLLALYTEIRQYKYTCNCQLYREMMETAIDNEDKKDELSRHHVDTIPERLCATLKQWGLTRINLQRRRFSIF